MAKYSVRCYFYTYVDIEVDADNENEAEEAAWYEAGKPIHDSKIAGNCVHAFAEIEELDKD